MASKRSAGRPDIRRHSGSKSKLSRGNARQRAAERRENAQKRATERRENAQKGATERREQANERRQRAAERREAAGKARENGKTRESIRENLKAGKGRERTVGGRTNGRPERALVKRGKGERQLVLRNRGIAERSARTPAARAMARATFGGRFADHFRNGDRRRWHHHHGHHHHGHHHHHIHVIGWIGPLFWPFAYYDFVDYTFWPYAYDAFWPYAYDDVYEGFFGPYAIGGPVYYADYVDVPAGSAPRTGGVRTTSRTSGGSATRARAAAPASASAQICTGETSGLTDWPIDRIAEAVNPDDTQRVALDELRAAATRAIELMRSACPDDLPSTPTGRMAAMRDRLEAMREAVQTVRPALDKFYEALSDEQKARFNTLGPDLTAEEEKARKTELSQACSTAVAKPSQVPTDRLERALRPTAEQKAALDNLNAATTKAAEMLTANCPTEETLTPPGRLAAMEGRLDAMLKALDVVQPALTQFYDSLSNEQKARFNQLGTRKQATR